MRFLSLVVLAALMALGTWFVGWWTVPVLGALWGLATGRDTAGRSRAGAAALAGVLAWAALLALDARAGRLLGLGRLFGSVANLPAGAFFALTLVFPALLAWSAAALGAALRRPARHRYYVPASRAIDETDLVRRKRQERLRR